MGRALKFTTSAVFLAVFWLHEGMAAGDTVSALDTCARALNDLFKGQSSLKLGLQGDGPTLDMEAHEYRAFVIMQRLQALEALLGGEGAEVVPPRGLRTHIKIVESALTFQMEDLEIIRSADRLRYNQLRQRLLPSFRLVERYVGDLKDDVREFRRAAHYRLEDGHWLE